MVEQLGKPLDQGRDAQRYPFVLSIMLVLALILSGCNLVRPAATTPILPAASPTNLPGGTPPAGSTPTGGSTPTIGSSIPGGMQIRFVNLTDGGTAAAVLDADGRPLVKVQVSVTGQAPVLVSMTANGFPAVDAGGHDLIAENTGGASPFTGEIPWSPMNGGGVYTLVALAMDNNKQFVQATVQVTVTGVPVFTPTPPPLDRTGAQQRISELIQQKYGVSIPNPSVYRSDSPTHPINSRWIGSAYYKGTRYYIDLYDDGHYAWSTTAYSDPAHLLSGGNWVLCRPSGNFRVLTVFVDYGNIGANRDEVLAKVPGVVSWLNGLYTNFALSQGLSAPLMRVEADAAYVSPPPAPGEFLTADEIRTLTGKDPSAYDFLMQIDLDANATLEKRYFSKILESGGGVALQGCGAATKFGIINIWSTVAVSSDVEGTLEMDFNHELSHLFGMLDNWPFIQAVGSDGRIMDDWIPYVMFGWTDTDGDGIPEINDPTPYGTTGPKP